MADVAADGPAAIEDAIHRALAKDPADRYASMLEFWQCFAAALDSAEVVAFAEPTADRQDLFAGSRGVSPADLTVPQGARASLTGPPALRATAPRTADADRRHRAPQGPRGDGGAAMDDPVGGQRTDRAGDRPGVEPDRADEVLALVGKLVARNSERPRPPGQRLQMPARQYSAQQSMFFAQPRPSGLQQHAPPPHVNAVPQSTHMPEQHWAFVPRPLDAHVGARPPEGMQLPESCDTYVSARLSRATLDPSRPTSGPSATAKSLAGPSGDKASSARGAMSAPR